MSKSAPLPRTVGFWNRGGFWKAAVLAVLYVALSIGLGKLFAQLFDDQIDADNVLASPESVFFGVMLPVIIGGIIFLIIAKSLGWMKELFGKQPTLSRGWWMWILPIGVLAFNIVRFAGADYSKFAMSTVLAILVLGLFVGFTEELITRGFAVNLLRRAGYKEFAVATLSSLLFAAMHLGNATSMAASTVAFTVVYTFFFGIAMYFTLRVTRNLIWPMLLHATTDPSGILLAGGIDTVPNPGEASGLAVVGNLSNFFVVLFGLILMWFIRGHVDRYKAYGVGEAASPVSAS